MAEGCCKNWEYKTCGPIKDGNVYCLFHKPVKRVVEAREFYEKLKEQAAIETDENGKEKLVFNYNVNWSGYVFPEDKSNLFFSNALFKGKVDFEGTIFKYEVNFRGATFKGWANFWRVTFKGDAIFRRTTFEGDAIFRRTTFEGAAIFKDATFKGEADFENATFKDWAFFEEATFKGESKFRNATYKRKAIFWLVNFKERVVFEGGTFEGEANFRDGTFEGAADFSYVYYKKEAFFRGALFERTCTFDTSKFEGRLFFTNTEFRQGIEIEGWENPKRYKIPQAKQEGCRVQKISYEKEGKKEAADAMLVREMRARRRDRESHYEEKEGKTSFRRKPLWNPVHISTKAEYLLVDLTSKYGTSWQRVIFAALLIIVFFAGIYFLGSQLTSVDPRIGGIYSAQPAAVELVVSTDPEIVFEAITRDNLLVNNFWKLLYFSITTFSTVGYGDVYPDGWMKYVAGAQSLLGAFFIALFVVVFARKWMR